MSWLLFMDESGHDHHNMPAEVRGGIAIHASKLWAFTKAWHSAEDEVFGVSLASFKKEIKGSTLLDKKRYRFARQMDELTDDQRRTGVRRFLTLSQEGKNSEIRREDFTAYGQACLEMARRNFQLLKDFDAELFASVIPKGVKKPRDFEFSHFLRKDHVFLLERFFYFLEAKHEHGLMVMDETDKTEDRRFVKRLQDYFVKTQTGRERSAWIVPTPMFVASDMAVGVQAADICLYCVNWAFRPPPWNFNGPVRTEIVQDFLNPLFGLQHNGQKYEDGEVYPVRGIAYVPDPYTARN